MSLPAQDLLQRSPERDLGRPCRDRNKRRTGSIGRRSLGTLSQPGPFPCGRFLRFVLLFGLMVQGPTTTTVAAPEQLVEQVAAVVEGEPITLSELRREAALRGEKLPSGENERRDFYLGMLDQLIDRKLISIEARQTPFIQVSESEVEGFIESYRRRFPSEEEWQRHLDSMSMDLLDFRELVKGRLLVNQFVQLRFEPFVIVLPDDIQSYYEEQFLPEVEASGQPAPPLELVEETIRQILAVERTNEELDQWVRNARRKASVQVLLYRRPGFAPNLPGALQEETKLIDIN